MGGSIECLTMEHIRINNQDTVRGTRCPVLNGLHSWNISYIVLGRGLPGNATPLGPLYGPGLSEGGAGEEDHRLPTQSAPLPTLALLS